MGRGCGGGSSSGEVEGVGSRQAKSLDRSTPCPATPGHLIFTPQRAAHCYFLRGASCPYAFNCIFAARRFIPLFVFYLNIVLHALVAVFKAPVHFPSTLNTPPIAAADGILSAQMSPRSAGQPRCVS